MLDEIIHTVLCVLFATGLFVGVGMSTDWWLATAALSAVWLLAPYKER